MAIYHTNDQVIELTAAESTHVQDKMAVKSVILSGGTAGEYQLRVGNTTYSIRTTTNHLTVQVDLCRTANEVELVSEPTGGVAYILLEQQP